MISALFLKRLKRGSQSLSIKMNFTNIAFFSYEDFNKMKSQKIIFEADK
jgi:hypothetical protein